MPYIWLDITTIYGWQRPAVGIIRVESECAAFALKHIEKKIRFCRFDTINRRYVEVPSNKVNQILERILAKKSASSATNQLVANTLSDSQQPLSIEQRLTNLALRIIGVLPQRWRGQVFNSMASRKTGFRAAVRSYREARTALREFLSPTSCRISNELPIISSPEHTAPFSPDDTYISLGLDWDQKDLSYVYAQKRKIGFKVYLFCYDTIPVKFPHLCVGDVSSKFARYFADLAWCADKILCISECSRNDLIQLLNTLAAPIPSMEVIKLGCDLVSAEDGIVSTEVSKLLNQKYILYVSTIERRKNHEVLYRAYTRLIDSGVTNLPLLVFVGMLGWGVNDLISDFQLDPRIQPYIRILNHVSDNELVHLYQNTYFTVYPSLYEGWGLPIAESLGYGKFCLASNAASIPEVGTNFIEYLDPWDSMAWAEKIQWYIKNPDDLLKLEKNIKDKYKATSWSDSIKSIFAIII